MKHFESSSGQKPAKGYMCVSHDDLETCINRAQPSVLLN